MLLYPYDIYLILDNYTILTVNISVLRLPNTLIFDPIYLWYTLKFIQFIAYYTKILIE